jgi:hypothetical protein
MLSEPKPWREVEQIETRYTKNGGVVWSLQLSCGHIAARHGGNWSRGVKVLTGRLRLAPKRVRCLLCSFQK